MNNKSSSSVSRRTRGRDDIYSMNKLRGIGGNTVNEEHREEYTMNEKKRKVCLHGVSSLRSAQPVVEDQKQRCVSSSKAWIPDRKRRNSEPVFVDLNGEGKEGYVEKASVSIDNLGFKSKFCGKGNMELDSSGSDGDSDSDRDEVIEISSGESESDSSESDDDESVLLEMTDDDDDFDDEDYEMSESESSGNDKPEEDSENTESEDVESIEETLKTIPRKRQHTSREESNHGGIEVSSRSKPEKKDTAASVWSSTEVQKAYSSIKPQPDIGEEEEENENEKEGDEFEVEVEEDVVMENKGCSNKMNPGKNGRKDVNVFGLFVKSIWENEVGSGFGNESDLPEYETRDPEPKEEELPLKFVFGIEEPDEPIPEESANEKELKMLFDELDFLLRSQEIGSLTSPKVEERPNTLLPDGDPATLCRQGRHDLILDEEIGLKCLFCSFVSVEINKYVSTSFEKYRSGSMRNRYYEKDDVSLFDKFPGQINGSNSSEESTCEAEDGTVWDVIPGVKSSMYFHQQEGFEFIWKNLTGTIQLDELRTKSVNTKETGGCIISHAPGTGKTRLTLVFLKSYLELFPNCRPVIIAPSSLLLTWEEEFRKWDIDIPFHNLNSLEYSGKESLAAIRVLEGILRRKLSMSYVRMVKLFSWSKKKSVLGVSYSLYEKLAGNKVKLDDESKELKKILLELPGLLVLDEGHTPRNKRSCIWKVLSDVKTDKKIILSGTPFQNNMEELGNILSLARPMFSDILSTSLKKFQRKRKTYSKFEDGGINELKALMTPFVHVHKGSILRESLKGLSDCVVVLNPPSLQKKIFENIDTTQSLFDVEHKLSLVSVHPSLINRCILSKKEESIIDRPMLENLKLQPDKGVKTKFLMEFIRLSEAAKEKVLVFSQYIDPLCLILEQIVSLFKWSEGKEVLMMNGKLDLKQRQTLITTFNDPNSRAHVLLASTKACSEGINLVGASRVVLLDVVWNPSVERQAISRAYRLGQKRMVYTYHLVIKGTPECDKYCKQVEKDRISELVFSSSENMSKTTRSTLSVCEDKILDEMVSHDKLKNMFEKIISQPKESDLVESFGSVML